MNKKIIITVVVLLLVVVLGIVFFRSSKNNKVVNATQEYLDLKYDIVIRDLAQQNSETKDGHSSVYYCELLNTEKSEKYRIEYSNILDKSNNQNDTIHIEVEDVFEDEFYNTEAKQELQSVKEYIDNHVENKYTVEIQYQRIDDINYNMLIDQSVTNIEASDDSKTEDGIWAIEYEYLLVNTVDNKQIRLYYFDVADEYKAEGERDEIIVEISELAENAVEFSNDSILELHSVKELLKNVEIEKCKINVNYID